MRRGKVSIKRTDSGFNPRTHTGCDTTTLSTATDPYTFQSTHPHGVRRIAAIAESNVNAVSIHAPTRGATENCRGRSVRIVVSIHAPTRGATKVGNFPVTPNKRFNPRTHTGCDDTYFIKPSYSKMFQSTHPHGVRRIVASFLSGATVFQSTHPHGVRLRNWP